ncbi:MAG TPA: TAT-variant-translocated molybdopterin oxidoreductase [Planctomicrobium sp.]|nr:TAT-variant-translocated molybdopterin oxidoreductase [Planctomicrobium sp.]
MDSSRGLLPILDRPLDGAPVQNTNSVRHWRTLEEYEADPEFLAKAQKEFAPGAEWWLDQPSRREFLKTMGASLALAGLTGCTIRQPEEKIIPYVTTPEHMIPGKPQVYATATHQPGGGIGLLVQAIDGRPIRVEGNPQHPNGAGAADSFAVASILNLYDPLRTKVPQKRGAISSWSAFERELSARLAIHNADRGAGLALLTEEILSPTLQDQLKSLLQALPEAKWYQYNSWESGNAARGTELAFGQPYVARYHLENADIIFAVEADFIAEGPSSLRNTKEFAARRVIAQDGSANLNRLYVAETFPTQTGSKADHWLRLPPNEVVGLLIAVARELGLDVGGEARAKSALEHHEKWVKALAGDLKAAAGNSAVIVGDSLPPEAQVIGHLINQELGSIGKTVTFVPDPAKIEGLEPGSISDLVTGIDAKEIGTLLILGGDPVFTAPRQLKFGEKLKTVPFAVYHGFHDDATAKASLWHTPSTHYLEEWGDTRSDDGTVAIIQPLIRPLYEGRSAHELLNLLAGRPQSGYEAVRSFWQDKLDGSDPVSWEKMLHDGVVKGTAFEAASVTVAGNALSSVRAAFSEPAVSTNDFTIILKTDPSVFDGRYATNGWLQEVPQPFTKLTWGGAALIGTNAAKKLDVKTRDVVALQKGNVTVNTPVFVQPGIPEGVIVLYLGNGREVEGHKTVGVDAYDLRDASASWFTTAKVTPTGKKVVLASTQEHFRMDGRDIVRHGTIAEVQANPKKPSFMDVGHHGGGSHGHDDDHDDDHDHDHDHDHDAPRERDRFAPLGEGPGATFYPEWPKDGYQWGMTINMSACTGCNACVIACQSENNIPVVGADQVSRGREMHWLRIDTYFTGDADQPDGAYHQPISCMHCEHAHCEPVCPVGATTHSDEGLNEMTYNRCIGTRYCSNNCPYKVRRFNFLAYNEQKWQLPVLQMAENPNVTVRSRGVMEKCTYCVQSISAARIQAKMENREIRDGEVTTACQSVCAANAISFGDVANETTAVAKMKQHPLNYGLLTDLNTRPRTSYLASVSNPNPALVKTQAEGHH